MGEAILIQRGSSSGEVVSGEVIVEFNNFMPSNVELSEELIHSTPTALSVARMELVGASVGNYALFAGGVSVDFDMGTMDNSDAVDAYDTSLTRSTPTVLSVARMGLAGASVGGYALFAGGISDPFSYLLDDTVDAYDTSLTRSTPTTLSVARGGMTGASVGDYALFVGGISDPFSYLFADTVDAYDTSLTRSTPTALSVARGDIAGARVGNYALFAGGFTLNGMFSDGSDVVDAYDTSLTRSTPTVLSVERESPAGASVGNYALFAGGFTYPYEDYVDAYDTSLTRSTLTSLSVAREGLAGASVGDYALFAGGSVYVSGTYTTDTVDTVEAYDTSLTRSTPTVLSVAREGLVGASVGDYALFAGGVSDPSSYLPEDTVDAYSPPVPMARLYMPIGAKYKFGESEEEVATTNEITVPVPITGYIKFKNGVISNEV